MQEQETIIADVEPLLKAAGISLVELSLSRGRGEFRARAVVYAPAGTGTAECAKAHRIIYPRLQVLLKTEDPFLEVASPGIDRALKSARECALFVGKGVKLLLEHESEWIRGRLDGVDGKRLSLTTKEGPVTIEFDAVAKARLDSTQEGD